MAYSATKRLADYLTAKGQRFTEQMRRVVSVALSKTGTFTHDDVLGELKGEASRATVYRTLAKMVQANVLRWVQFNGHEVMVAVATED